MATTSAVGYDILIPWGDTAPQSPTDCDLWFDTTSGILWRWSGSINRWMSQRINTAMNFVSSVAGSGQTITGTTGGTQIAFMPTPLNNDIYIYRTNVLYQLSAACTTGNYWTYNDDFVTTNTNLAAGATSLYLTLNTAAVVSKNSRYRLYAASTGTPPSLYTNAVAVEYVLLY